MNQIAIILNGPSITKVQEKDVIFADAGYKFKDELKDKNFLLVVGDFDSLKDIPIKENIQKLAVEKNFTDGEVAVLKAKELGAKSVAIYGALGGRIDHVLGNIALLKIAQNLGLKARIKDDAYEIFLASGRGEFDAKKGQTISIFPYGESCVFNKTKGLYYPLKDLKLTNGDTRGISNVCTDDVVEYEIALGDALIVINK